MSVAHFDENYRLHLRPHERALVSFENDNGYATLVIEYEHIEGGVWMRDFGRTDRIGIDRLMIVAG